MNFKCGALKEYMEKNGGKCPPTRYTHPMGEGIDDLKLGSWCHRQRFSKNKNKLKKERIKKLDKIKFHWGKTRPTKYVLTKRKKTSTSSPQSQKKTRSSSSSNNSNSSSSSNNSNGNSSLLMKATLEPAKRSKKRKR